MSLDEELSKAHAERESFYMDYRIKCDEQTKALHIEVEQLRQQLAVALNERDAIKGEWDKAYEIAMLTKQKLAASQETLKDHGDIHGECSFEIQGLTQQLAAAIAACKLKDEIAQRMTRNYVDTIKVGEAVQEILAIKPDDSALRAWLGEAVSKKIKYGALQFLAGYSELPPNTELYSPKGLR